MKKWINDNKIDHKRMDLIKIGKIKNKGNGLFANEHIPINTTIISISDD